MMLSLGFSALKAGMSYMGQQAQAEAQLEYQTQLVNQQNEYRLQNAQIANDAYVTEVAQENTRIAQEQQSTANEIEKAQRDTLKAAGTAIASSEGAGLGGALDVFRQFGSYRSNLETNLKWEQEQADLNKEGYRSKALGRRASVRPYTPQPVTFPSPIGAATSFLGGAFNTYNRYQNT
jgi:hypothetical protein